MSSISPGNLQFGIAQRKKTSKKSFNVFRDKGVNNFYREESTADWFFFSIVPRSNVLNRSSLACCNLAELSRLNSSAPAIFPSLEQLP
jgi:hypothetical protein